LGKVARVCFAKLTQAIWRDFGEQVAVSVFGRFFHVIDDQELAGHLAHSSLSPSLPGTDRFDGAVFKERSQHGPVDHLPADGISRLRADLVTVGIDPGRAPFEHRSRAHGVAVSLLTI
jgi:hypothetical protein